MAEVNPYKAPQASVSDANERAGSLRSEPRSVDAGRGLAWFSEGFAIFRQAPLIWAAIAVIAFVVFLVLGFIPFIGQLAGTFVSVLLGGGMMLGCRALARADDLTVGHLFAAFQSHASQLLVVGALYIAGLLLVIVAAGLLGGGAAFALFRGGAGEIGSAVSSIILLVLLVLALSLPLVMALWFAPALVVLNDLPAVDAMKLSFRGCLRNIVPFLVYGVIGLVAAVLATIPLMLGWLVLMPVIVGSIYAAHRDIFLDEGNA